MCHQAFEASFRDPAFSNCHMYVNLNLEKSASFSIDFAWYNTKSKICRGEAEPQQIQEAANDFRISEKWKYKTKLGSSV